jgi:hypothetical protein
MLKYLFEDYLWLSSVGGKKKKRKKIFQKATAIRLDIQIYTEEDPLWLCAICGVYSFFVCGFVGFRVPDILLQDHTHFYLDWISVCDKQRDIAHPGSMEQMEMCCVFQNVSSQFRAANSIPLIKQKQMLYFDLIIIS